VSSSYKLIPQMALSQQLLDLDMSDLGVPPELSQYLINFISVNHPGEQEKIYHNLDHTLAVANLFLGIISQFGLGNKWKVLGFLAGLLHDLDPERVPNTPPSVERTIQFLDGNHEIKTIIDCFCAVFGFTPKQIHTLILATDYSPNLQERKSKWDKFCHECAIHFDEGDVYMAQHLGKILAYADKSATYIQPIDVVVKRIKGLALELRTVNDSQHPTDKEMLNGTVRFLQDEVYNIDLCGYLPLEYQEIFRQTLDFFIR
jgi:hypothetical protein